MSIFSCVQLEEKDVFISQYEGILFSIYAPVMFGHQMSGTFDVRIESKDRSIVQDFLSTDTMDCAAEIIKEIAEHIEGGSISWRPELGWWEIDVNMYDESLRMVHINGNTFVEGNVPFMRKIDFNGAGLNVVGNAALGRRSLDEALNLIREILK